MDCGNSYLLGKVQDLSVFKNQVLRQVPWAIGLAALALGLLAAPGAASAAITITDTSSTAFWGLSDGAPTTSADAVMSGTETFTISASPTNSVLIVNMTEFAQNNSATGPDANPTITWNGTPLTKGIVQISSASSYIYADLYYLFDPTPGTNGSLVISGSGRSAEVSAYTLSGVNTFIPPVTYGHDSSNGTSAVSLSSATAAGSFAAITGAFRASGNPNFTYVNSIGPAASKLYLSSSDASTDVSSCSAYVNNLSTGATTISQVDNAGSRDEIAVAVFSAVPAGYSAWNVAGSGSWNSPGNWGSGVPTGSGAAAWFTSNPTTAAAVTLDAPITLNSLLLANSNQVTIAPGSGGSLTFAASSTNLPTVSVITGSHIISAPVSLNNNTTFNISASRSLDISGNIADGTASSGISLPASSGTLALDGNNTYSGTTSVAGGLLNVTGNLGNTPLVVSGGAMSVSGTVGNSPITVSSGSLNVASTLLGNNTISVSGGVVNLIVSGSNAVSLSGGALTLGGALTNLPPTVSGGTLSLPGTGEISQGQFTIGGNTTGVGGAVLLATGSNAITGSTALSVTGGATAILSQANNYTGATTANHSILQLGMAGSLYGGNSASWTPANISVTGSSTLAVNYGGPNDFTQSQAAALLSNLSASTSSTGLAAGAVFGLDTTNATTTVTYSGVIADTAVGPLTFSKRGTGTLLLTGPNTYSGPTVVTNGELILGGANNAPTVAVLMPSNTVNGGLTVLSIRNAAALGSGTANSSLAPISLNATGGSLSTAILEIGAKIGTDPGPYNADFSYQVVANGNDASGTSVPLNVTLSNGQINLGFLGNSFDGTGFAALTPSTTSPPRIVALYATSGGSLQVLSEKTYFGQGSGDHFTLGSPTSNNTLVLENPVDFQGSSQRGWSSIRGIGIVPEGEYAGAIINSASGNPAENVNFNGNGGLIFDSAATTYAAATLQINGGAVLIAANDPAVAGTGTPSSLGEGNATIQVGTSVTINPSGSAQAIPTTPGAHIAFMTYGPNAGVGSGPTLFTNRNITVGGTDVTYASATLGGMTDDWTQMNGNILLNEPPATPTTFTARNGGRVDFGGQISGSGSVVVGNAIVEGDATTAGIAVNNNGTIVFNGPETYTGATTVSAGKLYVNNSIQSSSLVTVGSGATLGGMGSVNSPVNVLSGGILEGGQSGTGALTLTNTATFSGPASVYLGGTLPAVGSPRLVLNGALNTNGNAVTINIASITGTGDFALISCSGGIQTAASNTFTLGELPNRAIGTLAFNNGSNELDLDVTSLAAYILWTGNAGTSWDTTSINWTLPGAGSTHYIDNPGDTVLFDDSAGAHTNVTLNSGDVHPASVTFNNNNTTYTISGSNAIAGSTGLQLTGTGTVVLLNTNTFTGATSIGQGATLKLGNGAAGNDGSISATFGINDNGNLVYNLAGAQSYGGAISGTGSLALQSGALTLTGSNGYTGATTISSGTLQLGNGAVNQDGSLASVSIANSGALDFNYFGSQTYAGAISGPGSLTKNGVGTLVLAASNNFTGATQVNLGTLQLADPNAAQSTKLTIGQFGSLTFAGGNDNPTIGGLAGAGGINLTDSTSGQVTLSVSGNGPNTTFSGSISGSGALTFLGPNSLTLSGASSYLGGTSLLGGTLVITNSNSLGAVAGQLNIGPGASTLEVAGNIADARAINFNDPVSTIRVDAGQSYNNTGTISGGGTLTKTGPGLLVLAGTTNSAITTAVSAGTLLINGSFVNLGTVAVSGSSVFGGNGIASDTTVQNRGTIDVSANNGSTLSLNNLTLGQIATDTSTLNFSAANLAIAQLAINGNLTTNGGNNSVTVNVGGVSALTGTYTLATYGSLNGTGSSAFVLGAQTGLTTRDSGALIVTGTAIDYVITGYYPIWRGTQGSVWTATNNWARSDTGAPTSFLTGDTVVFDDSAGTTAGGTTSVSISGTGNVSPGAVTFNNNAYNYTISGPYGITGAGALYVNGTGSVTMSTSNTYTGGTNINAGTLIANNSTGFATGTGQVNINAGGLLIADNSGGTATGSIPVNINGGTLQIGNGDAQGTLGAVPLDNGVLAFNRSDNLSYAGVISGTGSVVQHGSGMLTLTATNNYSGGTVVNRGTLAISTDANLGAVPGSVQPANIILNGGILQFNNGTNVLPVPATPTSYTINTNRGITLGPSGGTLNVNFVNTNQTFDDETAVDYAGVIAGSGGLTITGQAGWNQANQSIVNLIGNNTYAGGTTVNNAVLAFSDNNGPYTTILPATTVLNLVNSAALNIDASTSSATIAGLTGDPTALVGTCNSSSAVELIIDSTGSYTYNGVISAFTYVAKAGANTAISLVMSGSGLQNLSGASGYAGGTTVNGGTLQLGNNSALGTGGLTANGGVTDLNGFNPTLASLSGSAGLITNGGSANSLLTVNQGTTTFSGTIGNGPTHNVALTLGAGKLVLDGSNTYSGATTINGGSTLQLGGNDNNGSIGNSAVTDNGSLIVSRTDSVNLTSLISGPLSGSGSLTLNGSGTLTLTGTNTYTGGTVVDSGTMIAADPAAIEDGTNLSVGSGLSAFGSLVSAGAATPAGSTASTAVPEPATVALLSAGAMLLVVRRLRRRRGGLE